MPLEFPSFEVFLVRFALSFAAFGVILAVTFALVRVLGSKVAPPFFFAPLLQALCFSLWFCMALRLLALAVDFALGSHRVAEVVFSLTPFYAFALFGWVTDHSSQLRDRRGLVAGCIAALIFALMALVLGFPMPIPG